MPIVKFDKARRQRFEARAQAIKAISKVLYLHPITPLDWAPDISHIDCLLVHFDGQVRSIPIYQGITIGDMATQLAGPELPS